MSVDLNDQISKSGSCCLNESVQNSFSNLLMGDHTLSVKSDADEQLIVHVAFNQTVKLNKIQLGLPADGSCPATIKLFCNKNNLGFSEAVDEPCTQVISLEPTDKPSVQNIELSAVKWSRVDSITIFVEENHGSDFSVLHAFKAFGSPVHGTNVADIGKTG